MNNKDIINFKNQINNFSIDELNDERVKLQEQMSKMILENDLLSDIQDNLYKKALDFYKGTQYEPINSLTRGVYGKVENAAISVRNI